MEQSHVFSVKRADPSRAIGRTLGDVRLGRTSDASAALIRFGEGALAGTEVHLSAQGASHVTVELLTVGGESRQTLAGVMDEMRWRLRVKGIALSVVVRRPPGGGTAEADGSATSRNLPGRQPR